MMPRHHKLIWLSVLAALLTIGLKSLAYSLTGSVGLLSDAIESFINLAAALVATFALWYAAKPADVEHTYGHEKIEYFSSGLEGTLILLAAGGIAWYAVQRLLAPQPLQKLDIGSGLSLSAALINLAVGQILLRVGRRVGSIALEADGHHLMTDVWTSVAVLVGVGLVWVTDWLWIDPVIALLVAANITWTAFNLLRRSFDGLMDRALPEAEQAQVRAAIQGQLAPGMDYHALRTRRAGSRRFADFHLLVPGIFTVRRAHELGDRVESAVREVFPDMEITVHIEPIEERGSWEDSALFEWEQHARPVSDPE